MLTFDVTKHEYRVDGRLLPSVTQVLDWAGISKGCEFYTEHSRQRGSASHEAIRLMNSEDGIDWETLDPRLTPYIEAYGDFCSIFQTIESEIPLDHPIGFAGTFDALGFINNKLALVDYKTGKWQRSYDIQLCAYEMLLESNKEQLYLTAKDFPLNLCTVELLPTGKYNLVPCRVDRDEAREEFLNAFSRYMEAHQ